MVVDAGGARICSRRGTDLTAALPNLAAAAQLPCAREDADPAELGTESAEDRR